MKECPVCHHRCGDLAVKCPECNKLLFDINRPDVVQVPKIIRMKSVYNENVPNETNVQNLTPNFVDNNIDSYRTSSTETSLFQSHKSLLSDENFAGGDYSSNETLAFKKSMPIDIDSPTDANMYYAPPTNVSQMSDGNTARKLALLDAQREELEQKRIKQEQLRVEQSKEEQLRIEKARQQQEFNAQQAENIRIEHLEKIRIAREKLEEVRIAEEKVVQAQSVNIYEYTDISDETKQEMEQTVSNENNIKQEIDEQTLAEIARQTALKEESQRLTKIEQEKAEDAKRELLYIQQKAEEARIELAKLEVLKEQQTREEAIRREKEQKELERLENERLEQERIEAEKAEQVRLEAQKAEEARLELVRIEQERLEQERIAEEENNRFKDNDFVDNQQYDEIEEYVKDPELYNEYVFDKEIVFDENDVLNEEEELRQRQEFYEKYTRLNPDVKKHKVNRFKWWQIATVSGLGVGVIILIVCVIGLFIKG